MHAFKVIFVLDLDKWWLKINVENRMDGLWTVRNSDELTCPGEWQENWPNDLNSLSIEKTVQTKEQKKISIRF